MATYSIEPERRTLHAPFSREREPVLTIESGDSVRFRTLDAGWGLEPPTTPDASRRRFEPLDPEQDVGHALCGPIAIRGAQPGMTLEIVIGEIRTGAWGWTRGGGFPTPLNERLSVTEQKALLVWQLDPDKGIGRNQLGHEIKLRPFMGVMGMPADEPGFQPTWAPRATGGNIDCKELVAGSTLYLPIAVAGGLFSTGDGHAAQGDGELSGTGVECPIERVDLMFHLRRDLHIDVPRANTPNGWITFGLSEDLNEAMLSAVQAMIDFMVGQFDIQRHEALALASVIVDLHITQVVNGVVGVHAILPHEAIAQVMKSQ